MIMCLLLLSINVICSENPEKDYVNKKAKHVSGYYNSDLAQTNTAFIAQHTLSRRARQIIVIMQPTVGQFANISSRHNSCNDASEKVND